MERRKQILIVEDDTDIKELMEFHLSKDYYIIDTAENGRVAYDKILKNKYDLVIMDWMIPEISGLDIILWMKRPDHAHRKTPILMVTAKSDPVDIVAGLEKGADDYMVKPFDFAVLRARVQNLLKRQDFLNSLKTTPEKGKKLSFGNLIVDKESHKALLKGEVLDLTYSEFRLLEALILNQGKVLSRKQIMSFIQGAEQVVTGRTIDTHISSLRKKLKEYGNCIHTVRGIGYRVDMETDFQ